MKKVTNISVIVIGCFLTILSLTVNGQINSNYNDISNSSASHRVDYFLTFPNRESARIESGAMNETVEQIRIVDDENVCNLIQELINNDEKLTRVEQNVPDNKAKYYYQTENFYYLFWAFNDGLPHIGPKTIFVVIKKDFSQYWKYYF